MKISQILFKTARTDYKDIGVQSQNHLIRAGYISPLAAGIYTYLHFGQRSMRKIEQILREEMNRMGGDEICMPVVHPADIWKKTNRWFEVDESMVRFKDRSGRDMVLAMTHEEVVADLCVHEIDSYKQLPKLVYQIHTKFRDEARPRGGLIRVREFTMKDSYSLDRNKEGLEKQYIMHYDSYYKIFARAGLPVVAILSDTGMMGGQMAHEYMYLTPVGEDTVFISDDGKYKANKEIATFKKQFSNDPENPIEKIHTPGAKTIAELTTLLNRNQNEFCKAVFYTATVNNENKVIMLLVSGDAEVNTVKMEKIIRTDKYYPSTPDEIIAIGAVPGFASPIGVKRDLCMVIADEIIAASKNMITGANEEDYHFLNAAYDRDFTADKVADIVSAYDGALSPHNNDTNSILKAVRGIEVGNIFQLGTKYTEATNAYFNDEDGQRKPIVMGSYGIGVGRILACLAEEYYDDKGLYFPISVAPYHVIITSLADSQEVTDAASDVYRQLTEKGVETLFDDRDSKIATAGVKFADADLIGIPLRITISKRSLKNGGAEVKFRKSNEASIIPLNELTGKIQEMISNLFNELALSVEKTETWPG